MKIIRLFVLLCMLAGTVSSQKPEPKLAPNHPQTSLELKTDVISQTYCANNNLRLILRFTFRNSGSETLILYRYGFVIGRYGLNKDLNSVKKGKYKYDVRPMLTARMPPEVEAGNPNEEFFVILKPGESFGTETDAYLGIDDGSGSDHSLKPRGRYFLQLQVATWFADPARARELSERWRNTGTLWYGDLISLPMELLIKPYDLKDSCN